MYSESPGYETVRMGLLCAELTWGAVGTPGLEEVGRTGSAGEV